jgi:predicted  nucleic acid-binding Zn-ribbon protein
MDRAGQIPCSVALALALAACGATGERPERDLARAEAGIRQAEQGGAGQYGALELQAARDKLSRARAAVDEGEMDVAQRLAEQAALDAELAAAKTRSRKADLAVQEVENSIAVLQEEMRRRDRRPEGDRP